MKKIFMFTATTLGFFVIIIALFWLLSQKNDNMTAPKTEPTTNKSEETSHVCAKEKEKEQIVSGGTTYCIKEYKGNIAVFEQSKEKPFKITNIAVDELPTEDQKLLKQGIEVSGQEELNNLIEDYCS